MALNLLPNQTKNLERSSYGKLLIEKRSGVSVCYLGLMRNCFTMGELIVCHSGGNGFVGGRTSLSKRNGVFRLPVPCLVGKSEFAVVRFLYGTMREIGKQANKQVLRLLELCLV